MDQSGIAAFLCPVTLTYFESPERILAWNDEPVDVRFPLNG